VIQTQDFITPTTTVPTSTMYTVTVTQKRKPFDV